MTIARPIPGWTPSTPPIVGDSGLAALDERVTIAVHFWAPWNGVDPKFDELLRELADRFSSRVQFYSANIDLSENGNLYESCQLANIPALGVRVQGHWQQPIIGCPPSAEQLALGIESRLTGQMPLSRASRRWRWFMVR